MTGTGGRGRLAAALAAGAAAAAVAVSAPGAGISSVAPQASYAAAAFREAAAAGCRTVVKTVGGKRRRARVCAARPLNVRLALDRGRAASAVVGRTGGTVSASARGARLTLSIPAGALREDTRITLTPVTAVRGLRGLRFHAGVQFAPDGLALAKTATLTISRAGAAGARAIAWWEAGEDVSRYPSRRSGRTVRIAVTHFSGAAVAAGPDAAWSGVPDAEAALRARYAGDVRPALDRAAEADPLTSPAFEQAFGWEREVALLGLVDEFEAEIAYTRRVLTRAIVAAIERAATRCREGHDLSQVDRLARLDRLAQLFGIRVPGDSGFTRAVKCARFELDVEFRTAVRASSQAGGTSLQLDGDLRVEAKRLLVEMRSATLEGEQPLAVVSDTLAYSLVIPSVMSCNGRSAGAAPTAPLRAALVIDPVGYTIRGYPEVTLAVDPGDVDWSGLVTCEGGSTATSALFASGAYAAHWKGVFADKADAAGRLRLQVLPPLGTWVGGDVLATYGPETRTSEFGFPYGSAVSTLSVSFVLRHVPQR